MTISISDLDFPNIDERLVQKKLEIVELCKNVQKQEYIRGDYRELIDLVLLYLSDDNEHNIKCFIRPGALSRARWMSKMIYCIKLDLLGTKIEEELPKGEVFGSGQLQKVKKFVKFVVFCYIPWWLTCPVAAASPSNDLIFLKDLIKYQETDEISAITAFNAFSNHFWYLTEELVPIAIFCDSVQDQTKQKIVNKLKSFDKKLCSKRFGSGFGKPNFPKIPKDSVDNIDLSTFIGEDSWSIFMLMNLDCGFLDIPVAEWSSDDRYLQIRKIVCSFSVVNDASERGVKLAYDFLDRAKSEKKLQKILQFIENYRNMIPNQRKRMTKSKCWHLKIQ